MFGRKHREPFVDDVLGPLQHRAGHWRGEVGLPLAAMPLAVPGSRDAPDAAALAMARRWKDELERARDAIAEELESHRQAYDPTDERDATDVDRDLLRELTPSYVAVIELDRRLVLEFGYLTPWDDDHTLGARVRDGRLVDFCGSTLAP